jgi:hypothetical protein
MQWTFQRKQVGWMLTSRERNAKVLPNQWRRFQIQRDAKDRQKK